VAADGDLVIERRGRTGLVTLDRPEAMNALTLDMTRDLDRALAAWAHDPAVERVVIRAADGRAFCAGGDVRALYEAGPASELTEVFYREEYALNRRIFRFPKPYVALIDGIVMGGGVGISIHGSHRIVTERTMFAMPETGIGLFPDVGGTYFLPRCPGETGMYLGLTGARAGAADLLHLGLAEAFVPSARLGALTQSLLAAEGGRQGVDEIVGGFRADPGPAPIAERRSVIDRCFGGESVSAILDALRRDRSDFTRETLTQLEGKSPTSLKVAFRQIRLGRDLEFEKAMRLEFRLVQRFMAGHDFFEGVRAAVIDKDRRPAWRPDSLAEVEETEIDAYFASLGDGELEFPD
jgi:enoyl-CoA hydratase